MKRYYIVTMWSGGRPTKKWHSEEKPEVLPQGTGVRFRDLGTRLMVEVIGSISVEEYEYGMEGMTDPPPRKLTGYAPSAEFTQDESI